MKRNWFSKWAGRLELRYHLNLSHTSSKVFPFGADPRSALSEDTTTSRSIKTVCSDRCTALLIFQPIQSPFSSREGLKFIFLGNFVSQDPRDFISVMNGAETAPEWIYCLKGFRLKAAINRYLKISTLRSQNKNRCNTKHVRTKNVFICRHKPCFNSTTLQAAQKSTSSDDLQVLSRLRPSKDVPAYEITRSTTWNYFASTIGRTADKSRRL